MRWLNQPACSGEGEPNRRRGRACPAARKGEPDTKDAFTKIAVTDASLLLVILHYLLKNNTTFMEWNVQVKMSPGVPTTPAISSGGQLG